jgi:hypothetical protein
MLIDTQVLSIALAGLAGIVEAPVILHMGCVEHMCGSVVMRQQIQKIA